MKGLISKLLLLSLLILSGCGGEANYKEMDVRVLGSIKTGYYTGELAKQVPHGNGTFRADRIIFSGEWEDGLMNGYGSIDWQDGNRYEGEFLKGKQHGRGAQYFKGELVYRGTFKEGTIVDVKRDMVKISNNEPMQYVRIMDWGFELPVGWEVEKAQENGVYIKAEEGVVLQFIILGKVENAYYEEVFNQVKIMFSNEYKSEIILEDHNRNKPITHELQLTFRKKDEVNDVNCYYVTDEENSYFLLSIHTNGTRDYTQAARCITDSLKDWETVKEEIVEREKIISHKNIEQLLAGEIDWDSLKKVTNQVTAEKILQKEVPAREMVWAEGIIYNLKEDSFDLFLPHGAAYYKDEGWSYSLDLSEITQGDRVEVVIDTDHKGSLEKEKGILAIRRLDQPVLDIVSAYKESCPLMDYEMIMRNPKEAAGTVCKATGEILQVVSENYLQEFLVILDDGAMIKTTLKRAEGADELIEGDRVTFYGVFYETLTYTTVSDTKYTVPVLASDYVDIH